MYTASLRNNYINVIVLLKEEVIAYYVSTMVNSYDHGGQYSIESGKSPSGYMTVYLQCTVLHPWSSAISSLLLHNPEVVPVVSNKPYCIRNYWIRPCTSSLKAPLFILWNRILVSVT